MSVLAKKLTRNEYCRLNVQYGEVKNKDDITIVREITFLDLQPVCMNYIHVIYIHVHKYCCSLLEIKLQ